MPTKVVFVTEQGDVQLYLRRYAAGDQRACAKTGGYCDAETPFQRIARRRNSDGCFLECEDLAPQRDDPRWPRACEACGVAFAETDVWQVFQDRFMVAADGREFLFRALPPGACWDASWLHGHKSWTGPDGRSLHVILPNSDAWCIDARASNCTLPNDFAHKCWVRHGRPEDGSLHVDKNGLTCAAGAGSIAVKGYHGFLHNGVLTDG